MLKEIWGPPLTKSWIRYCQYIFTSLCLYFSDHIQTLAFCGESIENITQWSHCYVNSLWKLRDYHHQPVTIAVIPNFCSHKREIYYKLHINQNIVCTFILFNKCPSNVKTNLKTSQIRKIGQILEEIPFGSCWSTKEYLCDQRVPLIVKTRFGLLRIYSAPQWESSIFLRW